MDLQNKKTLLFGMFLTSNVVRINCVLNQQGWENGDNTERRTL